MRRFLGRASRRLRRQYRGPRVAIVLAVSDEETTRIGPLLDSVREQTHRNLDIVVAPWGASQAVQATARRHAEEDWRIQVLAPAATDSDADGARARAPLGAAPYVLYPAGGDLLPRDAVARLVASLERTGSDAAIGRVAIPRQGYAVASTAYALAHRIPRPGVTLVDAPEAVTDLTLGARLLRTPAAATGLTGLTGTFDLLPGVTYLRTGRRDDVVFGSRPHTLAGLAGWWQEQQRIGAAIGATGHDAALGWWRWSLLDTHLHAFTDDVERATPEQWGLLRAIVAELTTGLAAPSLPVRVGAEAAVKLRLVAEDRRADLADLVVARTFAGGDQPTTVEDGVVVADLPVPADLPRDLLAMSETETALLLDLRGLRREGGRTVLELVAWIDHLDLPEPPALEVVPLSAGVDVERIEVVQRHDITANHGEHRSAHDIAHGAFTLSFAGPEAGTARFRITLTTRGVTRTGELAVDLAAPERAAARRRGPLADDEAGPFHQSSLQRWATVSPPPVEPDLCYLQSYSGQHATDSQRAIHDELHRRFPSLRLVWGVTHPDVALPEGADGVVIGSRDWYRTMATARYLCLNTEPDRWFTRREDQLLLQTFHGYPAKAMGLMMWRSKGLSERRIAWELERVNRNWSLILTPTEEMAAHYREQYAYDGPILSVGYPRDDVLVSPEAPGIRARVRESLGIAAHQRAVLYAPTWRDDLATDWRTAEAALELDVARAARELGSDYVLLLRGHRFHTLPEVAADGARILDVTGHREVNELILAADAAVVDYSSIRFDLAFAGVPQVFLVPDLESYGSRKRGFLFPFTDSAPGPLVADTGEVVEQLRDLTALRERYAPEVASFNERFQPWHDDRAAARVVDELVQRWGLGAERR